MITEVITRAGKRIHVLSETDLDVDGCGERLRAFCPIHGSDHQRSMSIDAQSGWGYCHQCHATVFVEDYNTQIAATLKRGEYHGDSLSGPPASADIHHSRSTYAARARPPISRPRWQRDEVAALCASWSLLQEELASARADAYLNERVIPPEIADAAGVGYLSRAAWEDAPVAPEQRHLLSRWIGRVVFPLGSPNGQGFIGRTLVCWEPGMDENEHKSILQSEGIKRWIKTNPAGWFGLHPSLYASTLILVEGGFDRLALIAAGIPQQRLVALAGTAARSQWIIHFAPQVRHLVLALDGDSGGHEAIERLADEFRQAGLAVDLCPPPQDGWGKDWSERYRRSGPAGVQPLLDTLASKGCRT